MSDRKRKNLGQTPNLRVHIRRCHICNGITECDENVVKSCAQCGKSMAPFYFFEESEVVPLSDIEVRPAPRPGSPSPVRGLSAYW